MTCNFCQKMPLPAHARPGVCSSCSAPTTSSTFMLCANCSRTQQRCNRCGRNMSSNPLLQNACEGDSCACII